MEEGEIWRKATGEQVDELVRIRRIVSQELRRLRRKLRVHMPEKEQQEAIGEVLRLSQLQMKVIPLEQGLRKELAAQAQASHQQAGLAEEDWLMLTEALGERGRGIDSPSEGAGVIGGGVDDGE